MQAIFWVFVGGGLGSIFRYIFSKAESSAVIPLGTIIANFVSCFVLGLLLGLSIKEGLSRSWSLLLMTGFCGGFSTFSTFSMEVLQMIQQGSLGWALLYVLVSVLVGVLLVYFGYKISGI